MNVGFYLEIDRAGLTGPGETGIEASGCQCTVRTESRASHFLKDIPSPTSKAAVSGA